MGVLNHLQGASLSAPARGSLSLPLVSGTLADTSVGEIDVTNLLDTIEKSAPAGTLKRGRLKATIPYDPATVGAIPIGADPETWKLTFKLRSGQTTADSFTFTGWLVSIGAVDATRNGRPTVALEFAVNSVDTFAAGS